MWNVQPIPWLLGFLKSLGSFPVAKNKVQAVATSSPAPGPRLLNLKAAAAHTGLQLWFLRKLVWDRKIPHVRLGGECNAKKHKIYFERKDLDAYIDGQKVPARA